MFLPNERWAKDFAKHADLLGIAWRTETRVDVITAKTVEHLAQAGLRVLDLGLESASPRQILAMGKARDPDRYLRSASSLLQACRVNGVKAKINVLLYAGETRSTLDETTAWLVARRDAIAGISVGPVLAYGPPMTAHILIKGWRELGARPIDDRSAELSGITPIHLSPDFPAEATEEASLALSRLFMDEASYFALKSFSYYPRDYGRNNFDKDVAASDPAVLPFAVRNSTAAYPARGQDHDGNVPTGGFRTAKMIKDPIHGSIEFEGEAELKLKSTLSDPYFQRLRRVKQLGFADFVFPSATHSRFGHSLGVYAVTKRLLSVVESDVKKGNWSEKGCACLAAALLHDIGHGMFSHAFENAMKMYAAHQGLLNDDPLMAAVDHERISERIVKVSSITHALEEMGGMDFPGAVADIIAKKDETSIYTSLVSSQLDADRLDYAKRDPYFAGVSSGGIDLDWLVRHFRVGNGPGGEFLYVNSKAYISLEQFTVTLFQLYPTLYLHKKNARGRVHVLSVDEPRIHAHCRWK